MSGTDEKKCRGSIVIASYNRCDDLQECLASIPWTHCSAMDVEVIVIDDGSTDDTVTMVSDQYPEAQLLVNETNQGLSQAHNRATLASLGELIMNIDSDVVVSEDWLNALLDADDGKTVLGGRILDYGDGHDQGGPRRATFLGKSLECSVEKANVGTGANLAFPRVIFDAIEGFDEDLPYYFEDRDFCIRAGRAGYGFRYVAEASLRHKGSEECSGEAIRLQERHSVYAMLKAYRRNPFMWLSFTLANGLWVDIRLLRWGIRGRFADCRLLLSGWWSAYARFLFHPDRY